jgi:hypothetical protein
MIVRWLQVRDDNEVVHHEFESVLHAENLGFQVKPTIHRAIIQATDILWFCFQTTIGKIKSLLG